MSYVRKYVIEWDLPADPDRVGVNVYLAPIGETLDYNTPCRYELGNVSEMRIPEDIPSGAPSVPIVDGILQVGVAPRDDVGNLADMVVMTAPFDVIAPLAVVAVRVRML